MKPNVLYVAAAVVAGLIGCAPGDAPGSRDGNPSSDSKPLLAPMLLGINIDPENSLATPSAAQLDEVGVRAVRFTFKVNYKPELVVDATVDEELDAAFAFYDKYISEQLGSVDKLMVLTNQTVMQERFGEKNSDEYRVAFAARSRRIAEHYKGWVSRFEIWNEEDHCEDPQGFCPYIPVDRYALLLGDAAKAIHDGAGAGVLVSNGGFASDKWHEYSTNMVSLLEQQGQLDYVDRIATHPYTHWPEKYGTPNTLEWQFGQLQNIGKQRSLWITEYGVPEGGQPAYLKAVFEFLMTSPSAANVESAYAYSWSDSQDPRIGFGLYDLSGNKTEAWQVFHDFAKGTQPTDGGTTDGGQTDDGGQGDAGGQGDDGGGQTGQTCTDLASSSGWSAGLCVDGCGGQATNDCGSCCPGTSLLWGHVRAGGSGIEGVYVSTWSHASGTMYETYTTADGQFVFEGLEAGSLQNIAVNGKWGEGGYVAVDEAHEIASRDNIALVADWEGWHYQSFDLGY